MAAFEDNFGPDLEQYQGCKWTEWQRAVEEEGHGDNSNANTPPIRHDREVATLKREDLGLYGFCPTIDNFYVVVCKYCRRSIKPQTFHYHVEKHHGVKASKAAGVSKSANPVKAPFAKPSGISQPSTKSLPGKILHETPPMPKRPDQKKISEAIKNAIDKDSSSKLNLRKHFAANEAKHLVKTRNSEVSPGLTEETKDRLHGRLKRTTHIEKSHPVVHDNSKMDKILKSAKQGSDKLADVSITQSLSNGPVVVLKKTLLLQSAHGFKESSTPFRQYKHHHNPQLDIVKAVDRGNKKIIIQTSSQTHSLKPKKNIPLKAREYDPNKHCGVWVKEEQMRCTRSLTCKTHARSFKRQVPDRRKPYDELLHEHALSKQRLKEQEAEVKSKPNPSIISKVLTEAPKPPFQHKAIVNISAQDKPPIPKLKVVGISKVEVKSPVSSTSKTKNVLHLFPRSTAPRHIDCWKDTSGDLESEKEGYSNQHCISHHPLPIAVNTFGGCVMQNMHVNYKLSTRGSWRKICSSFSRSQTLEASRKRARSNVTFTPLQSSPFPDELRRTRANLSNMPSDLTFALADKVFNTSYASSATLSIANRKTTTLVPPGHGLKKSSSIDNSAMMQQSAKGTSRKASAGKMSRSKRFTVEYGCPPESTYNTVRQENGEKSGNVLNWPVESTQKQAAATRCSSTSASEDLLDLSSLLTTGQDEFVVSCKPSKFPTSTGNVTFKIPSNASHPNNYHLPTRVDAVQAHNNSKRSHAIKQRRNSVQKALLTVNHEGRPLNGVSAKLPSNLVSFESLLQQGGAVSNEPLDAVRVDNLSFTTGSVNMMEQMAHNSNNSNNYSHEPNDPLDMLMATTSSSGESLSTLSMDKNGVALGLNQLTRTGEFIGSNSTATGPSSHALSNSFCNVDYVQLTPESRPVDPGGGSSDTGNSQLRVTGQVAPPPPPSQTNLLASSDMLVLSNDSLVNDQLVWNL